MGERVFHLEVLEGRGFGSDPQALLCTAKFNNTIRTTPYSISTDDHSWQSTLMWHLTADQLRKLHSSGAVSCKVSVMRRDGTNLGWTVLDLRSAKLAGHYQAHPEGQWISLNSTPASSSSSERPQLRLRYTFGDARAAAATAAGASTAPSSTTSTPLKPQRSKLSASSRASSLRRRRSSMGGESDMGDGVELQGVPAPGQEPSGFSWGGSSTAGPLGGEPSGTPALPPAEASAASAAAAGEQPPTPVGARHAPSTQQQQLDITPQQLATEAEEAELPQATGLGEQPDQAALTAEGSLAAGASAMDVAGVEANSSSASNAAAPSTSNSQQLLSHSASEHVVLVPEASARSSSFFTGGADQQLPSRCSSQPEPTAAADGSSQLLPGPSNSGAGVGPSSLPAHPTAAAGAWPMPAPNAPLTSLHQATAPPQATPPSPTSQLLPAPHPPDPPAVSREQSAGPAEPLVAAVPAGPAGPCPDPVRSFVFTLELRSFQAGRRLPVGLASVYVVARLPQELTGFLASVGAALPPRSQPLQTLPAVDVSRGSEGQLPGGVLSVGFSAGVMGLAGLLAAEPRVVLEVWHKERLRADLLLGVGSVSLSPLLQDCWVDGYARVYALMAPSSSSGSAGAQEGGGPPAAEKVQVGRLRVLLELQDVTGTPAAAAAGQSVATGNSSKPAGARPAAAPHAAVVQPAVHAVGQPQGSSSSSLPKLDHYQQQQQQRVADTPAQGPLSSGTAASRVGQQPVPSNTPAAAAAAVPPGAGEAGEVGDFRQLPEYLVAWELEVWKKSEEAKFRAELRELELQRCALLEATWAKRTSAAAAAHAAAMSTAEQLQQQARAVLVSAEGREAKLVAGEEALARRQKELERQAAARLSEAEAAVRRIQAEAEHQLALERSRTEEVARQRAAAEQRVLTAEAAAAALEAQFAAYRAEQRATPEGEAAAQLAAAQQQVAALQQRLARATSTKRKYKEQVLLLAREVAALQQQQQQQEAAAAALAAATAARAAAGAAAAQQAAGSGVAAGAGTGVEGDAGEGLLQAAAREQLSAAAARVKQLDALQAQLAALRATTAAAAPGSQHSSPQQPPRFPLQQLVGGGSQAGTCPSSAGWVSPAVAPRGAQLVAGKENHARRALQLQGGATSPIPPAAWGPPAAAAAGKLTPQAHQQQQQHDSGSNSSRSPSPAGLRAQPSQAGKAAAAAQGRVGGAAAKGSGGAGGGGSEDVLREVRRLLAAKADLLSSGVYTQQDSVVQQLEARLMQLASASAARD